MKKLDQFVLKSAVGPFLVTLFIGNLVFLMQFLYRKLDEIIGKGLGWEVIGELIMYASFTLVPYSLPLAVLISSIMTMGNLGERYELVAMKASGISLLRILTPLIIAAFFMSGVAFYFSNNVMPYSLLKLSTLRWDIKNKKPTMLLEEGVFFNDFDNMTMKIEKKGEGEKLYGVTIYDHRKAGKTKVIKADSARIESSDSTAFMKLLLMDGILHEDVNIKDKYTRFGFSNLDLIIDMRGFEMGSTNEDVFKDNAKLKNVQQITVDSDSLELKLNKTEELLTTNLKFDLNVLRYKNGLTDSLSTNSAVPKDSVYLGNENKSRLYSNAVGKIKSLQQKVNTSKNTIKPISDDILKHKVAFYQKFALAFSCVVLFFIGAPMGALVRKGGFGLPIVIAILFYLIYYIINITGTRFAEDHLVSPVVGIWLSTIILFPVAIILTRMAISDLKYNPFSAISQSIQQLFSLVFKKK